MLQVLLAFFCLGLVFLGGMIWLSSLVAHLPGN